MGNLYIADKPILGRSHLYLVYDPDNDPDNSERHDQPFGKSQ